MKPALVRNSWDLFSSMFPRLSCEIDYWRRNKNFEKDLWLVPKFCNSKSGSIDVGVNEGVFSRWMAKYSDHVDSFECNPHLLPKLKTFLPRNVRLHQCALSSDSGTATLRFDPKNTGIGTIESQNRLDRNPGIESVLEVEVPKCKLDEFGLGDVSFVKIDVEGHELEVLKGATVLIERARPVLLVEIEERHCQGNLELVPKWLSQFGYKTHCLNETGGQLVKVDKIADHAKKGVNNFWFLP